MKKLYGVVVPIITPFNESDQVDVDSLKSLTEYVITQGLNCIYPCGTTGEMCLLNIEERKIVVEAVVNQTAGRIPVYAQVGAVTEKETLELARHAVESGCDGIGVVTPIYYKLSDQGLIDFFTHVAESVPDDFPVYLYGIPQNAVNDISLNVACEVAKRCSNVIGIKYSSPDMTKLQQFMMINQEKFSVLVGPDHLFQAVMAAGGEGVVSGNAMILPMHYRKIWTAVQQGDYESARRIQRKTNVLNQILCEINNISAYKILLKKEGIIRTDCLRAPMEQLTLQQQVSLYERLEQLNYRRIED